MNQLISNEYLTYCLIKFFHSLETLLLFSFLSFGMIELASGDYCRQQIINNPTDSCLSDK